MNTNIKETGMNELDTDEMKEICGGWDWRDSFWEIVKDLMSKSGSVACA